MSQNHKSPRSISRRNFLKVGGLSAAAAGLAACGIASVVPTSSQARLDSFSFGEKNMNGRILITYASMCGSTADIAADIGKAFADCGFLVDVKPVLENPSLEGYQAILIGSAIKFGNWLPEAVEFVKANRQKLGSLPVALFCVHIRNTADDEESRKNRIAYLDEIRPLVQAINEGFFPGRFDRRGAAMLLPGILARITPPFDFRKPKAVRSWSENLSTLLAQTI